MTKFTKSGTQKSLPDVAPSAPLHLHQPAQPPAKRQATYRERLAEKQARNAAIANEAMGIVHTVRAMHDVGVDLQQQFDMADECDVLRAVRRTLNALADPFLDEGKLVAWRNATVTAPKVKAPSRAKRERAAK